jgi:hypothetical protein
MKPDYLTHCLRVPSLAESILNPLRIHALQNLRLVNKFFHEKVRAHLTLEILKFAKKIDNEKPWINDLDYETDEKCGLIHEWDELKYVCESLWFTPEYSDYVDIFVNTRCILRQSPPSRKLDTGIKLTRFFSHFKFIFHFFLYEY